MTSTSDYLATHIPGAIAETIAEWMFRGIGFYVIRFGQEHHVSPLTQFEPFINRFLKNKFPNQTDLPKFKLEKYVSRTVRDENGHTRREHIPVTFDWISTLPDFVLVHQNDELKENQIRFLEVKYRHNGALAPAHRRAFDQYPTTAFLVVNQKAILDAMYGRYGLDNESSENNEYFDNELANTHFHIWEQRDNTIWVGSLKRWLKEIYKDESERTQNILAACESQASFHFRVPETHSENP